MQGVLVREGRSDTNTCKLWRSSSSGAGGVLPNSAWRGKEKERHWVSRRMAGWLDGWMAGWLDGWRNGCREFF